MKGLGRNIRMTCGTVGAMLLAAVLPVLSAAPANAGWYSGLYPTYSYSYSCAGQSMRVTGQARQHNYGCGLKDCDTVDYVAAAAYRTSGAYASNLARVSASTGFSGIGVSSGICHASTWGWISSVTQTSTGGFRFGTHWEARTASASVKVAGF